METALTVTAKRAFAAYRGEGRALVDALIAEVERLTDVVVDVHSIVAPKPPDNYDFKDAIKIKHYDELRRKLYG